MKIRFLIAASLVLSSIGLAQAKDEFGPFKREPINAPGSYRLVPDPTGEASSLMVHRFTIKPGKCSNSSYDNGESDCTSKSVRSQLYESSQKQPKQAWYAWNMYLPADFPVYTEQAAAGLYSFGSWHNGDCPHVSIVSDTGFSSKLRLQTMTVPADGSNGCAPDKMITIGDLNAMRGKWHRFEVHAKWSAGGDGIVDVFLDGAQVASHRGATLTKGRTKKNYFKFGVYLCCTKGVELVTPATVLYTGVARSDTRDGLSEK
jgi:polysaccharide lyase-like protein